MMPPVAEGPQSQDYQLQVISIWMAPPQVPSGTISDAATCEEALAEATSIFLTDTPHIHARRNTSIWTNQERLTVVPRGKYQECATMGMEMANIQTKRHIHNVRTDDLHHPAELSNNMPWNPSAVRGCSGRVAEGGFWKPSD